MHLKKPILLAIAASFLLSGADPAEENPRFSDRNPRYRLQASDVLELQYRYTPEFNQTATIQPDGFVTLTVAGDVKAAGLTLNEARSAILEKASVRLRDPELLLVLKEFEKPYFVVAGNVTKPGKYEIHGEVTAVEAIAMAGGFTEKSKNSQVVLYRRVGPDMAEAKLLDMDVIMKASGLDEDPALRPGDMLVVPQNRISKVERFLRGINFSWGIWANPIAR